MGVERLNKYLKILYDNSKEEVEELKKRIGFEFYKEELCHNRIYWDYKFYVTSYYAAETISDSFYGYFIREEESKYLIGCTLPIEGPFFTGEYDRSEAAFKLYKEVYGEKLVVGDKSNGQFKFDKEKNECIVIAGDIDFNFKMNKIKSFIDIIDNGISNMKYEEKSDLKNRILSMHEFTYHPDNISLMPVTGALNNIKQYLGNDRLDTFLLALKLYYEEGTTSFILSAPGRANMPVIANKNNLKNFLDSFKDEEDKLQSIYKYCEQIYHIDSKLVNDLCLSGKKPIDTPERVLEYIELACRFWEQKNRYYRNSNKEIQSIYQEMIKELVEKRGEEYINTFTFTKVTKC